MRKEHLIAIFFGAIMVLSAAGFAISGINFGNKDSGPAKVPSIVDKELTKEEFRSVLLSGKTIIRNHYVLGCAGCDADRSLLSSFAADMQGFVVLEQFAVQFDNETVLDMVSSNGRITELSAGLNETSLLDEFCSASYVQPKECLMRGI